MRLMPVRVCCQNSDAIIGFVKVSFKAEITEEDAEIVERVGICCHLVIKSRTLLHRENGMLGLAFALGFLGIR